MTTSRALELLNWTTPAAPQELVDRARQYLDSLTRDCPLKYKVAAGQIIRDFS